MIFLYIGLGIIAVYILFTVIAAIYFARMIMYPEPLTDDTVAGKAIALGRYERTYLDSVKREDFTVESRFGYTLHGMIADSEFSALPENHGKVAVVCHGYTSCKISMLGYCRALMELGFTCVLYDHRHHGHTGAVAPCTMSYFEKYDLQTVLDWVYDYFGSDIRVMTYGESMGSATVLGLYSIDSRPVLTVADCGFSNLTELCRYLMTSVFHVPNIAPIIPVANLILKHYGKFTTDTVTPIDGVKCANVPILFCHGTGDTFIPCENSVKMSKEGPGVRELYLCEGANHALSEITHPEEYYRTVKAFIKKYY